MSGKCTTDARTVTNSADEYRRVGAILRPKALAFEPTCTDCKERPAKLCGACIKNAIEEAVDSYIDDKGHGHCQGCVRAGAKKCPGVEGAGRESPTRSEYHRQEAELHALREALEIVRDSCGSDSDLHRIAAEALGSQQRESPRSSVDACIAIVLAQMPLYGNRGEPSRTIARTLKYIIERMQALDCASTGEGHADEAIGVRSARRAEGSDVGRTPLANDGEPDGRRIAPDGGSVAEGAPPSARRADDEGGKDGVVRVAQAVSATCQVDLTRSSPFKCALGVPGCAAEHGDPADRAPVAWDAGSQVIGCTHTPTCLGLADDCIKKDAAHSSRAESDLAKILAAPCDPTGKENAKAIAAALPEHVRGAVWQVALSLGLECGLSETASAMSEAISKHVRELEQRARDEEQEACIRPIAELVVTLPVGDITRTALVGILARVSDRNRAKRGA